MLRRLAIGLVLGYRRFISPLKPPTCRFLPTCSQYAVEAFQVHGVVKGGWLTTRRICRCHPLGGHGYDPVPPPRENPVSASVPMSASDPDVPGITHEKSGTP